MALLPGGTPSEHFNLQAFLNMIHRARAHGGFQPHNEFHPDFTPSPIGAGNGLLPPDRASAGLGAGGGTPHGFGGPVAQGIPGSGVSLGERNALRARAGLPPLDPSLHPFGLGDFNPGIGPVEGGGNGIPHVGLHPQPPVPQPFGGLPGPRPVPGPVLAARQALMGYA